MTDYQIVEGKLHHCGQMARALRLRYRHEFEALGLNVHRELRAEFSQSYFCRAWLVDGKLAALGGVSGTQLSSAGKVWLALAQDVTKRHFAIVREAMRQLDDIMQSKTVLTARILPGDEAARRFARFLGFRPAAEGWIELRREWPEVEQPFVVFCLPRSRSRWLATFLSAPGIECSHDLPVSVGSVDELCEAIRRGGTVETGLSRAWRLIRDRIPNVRFAVVRRSVKSVKASAARFGWRFPPGYLEAEEQRLDEISGLPGTLTFNYEDLGKEHYAELLYEHCTQQILPPGNFGKWNPVNLQIDMAARHNLLDAYGRRMMVLFTEIDSTITFQQERFDPFYRDATEQGLFSAHYAEAGSIDGLPLDPNVELARNLERAGHFLAMTARMGDRMIGYIVFLINPSFESRGVLLGFQNIFYVLPGHRGKLGLRLHAAARAVLRAKGVKHLILRSGVRARGSDQRYLFERLGAKPMGGLYMLPLEG